MTATTQRCPAKMWMHLRKQSKAGRELAKCLDCGKTVTVVGDYDADGWSQHRLHAHNGVKAA